MWRKFLIVVNTHAHVDHNSGNYQFEEVCVGRYDEPFSHQIVDQELREMSELMFFEIPEKRDFRLKCGIPDRQEKSVQSGMGISLIWEIKNLSSGSSQSYPGVYCIV